MDPISSEAGLITIIIILALWIYGQATQETPEEWRARVEAQCMAASREATKKEEEGE